MVPGYLGNYQHQKRNGNLRPAVAETRLLFHNQLHEVKQKPALHANIVDDRWHDRQAVT